MALPVADECSRSSIMRKNNSIIHIIPLIKRACGFEKAANNSVIL